FVLAHLLLILFRTRRSSALAHAHRLRRDAPGHSPGAGEQLVRVGVEPVEVDDRERSVEGSRRAGQTGEQGRGRAPLLGRSGGLVDRKSTRLNSSHVKISYAV